MLKRLSPAERVAALLDAFSEAIRVAFLSAIAEIKSNLTLSMIADRLEKGDIDGAVNAIEIEASAFNPMLDAVRDAYNGGGLAAVESLPTIKGPDGHRVLIRFDVRNPVAEQWLRDHSSALVTQIVDDQKQAIRDQLAAGMSKGQNPRTTALDIIGRVNSATGDRTGGIIGLTSTQAEWVRAYAAEIEALDPNALTRALRDKRFDRTVAKAIADGKPLPASKIASIVTAYQNRALRYRGEAIARTESLTALNSGSNEAMRQAVAAGKLDAKNITKVWHATHDERTRTTHALLDGQAVPLDGFFVSSSGARLRFPGDPDAAGAERINCRCWLQHKVDFLAGLK